MKTLFVKRFAAALATALALACGPAASLADEYKSLAEELCKTARAGGFSRLAMGEFSAKGLAGQGEAREAQLRLSDALFASPDIGVMDASVLGKLKERGQQWAQMLIRGDYYRTEAGAALVVKIIHVSSGRSIATKQISIREEAKPGVPNDLRDAPADDRKSACARAREQLQEAGLAAIELKARYWAARMRAPGFQYSGLVRAPGSELRDYATVQKFYELVNAYYEQDEPIIFSEAENSAFKALQTKEAELESECRKDS